MPASAHRAVQTDTHDGRKFITYRVTSNGAVRYRKVYLQTKNGLEARRWDGMRSRDQLWDWTEQWGKVMTTPGVSIKP
jgi:hypothetical protein